MPEHVIAWSVALLIGAAILYSVSDAGMCLLSAADCAGWGVCK